MRGPFQTLPSRETGLSYDRGALDYDPSTAAAFERIRYLRRDDLRLRRR